MSEAQLKRAVLDALKLIPGVRPLRMNAGKMVIGSRANGDRRFIDIGEAGTPDVLVMLPGGEVCWLELKTDAGRVSPTQKHWHEQAGKLGHAVYVVRSVEEAVRIVRQRRDAA